MINSLGQKLRHAEDLARLKAIALIPPDGSSGDGRAIVVWDPELQVGLVTAEKLPALPAGRAYQIWIVDPASTIPVSGGVFRVSADGRAVFGFKPDKPISLATAFSISSEEKDGVARAAGPAVLLGK
jgi:anti-sigma-K factor RskA